MRALPPLVLSLLAAGCAGGRASAPSPVLGQAASFALPTEAGGLFSVPTAERRPLVLDFFSPACKPCKEGVPALFARKAEIEQSGARLVLVGVLADGESTDAARQALASWGVRAPFLVDRGSVGLHELGVDKLPATVVLDGKGVVRWVAPPDATPADVVAAVR